VFAAGVGEMPKGKAAPVSVDGPDGRPLGSIEIGEHMWMSMAICGARQIVVTTIAKHGSEKLHRRVLRTLACTPDAAKEAAVKQGGSALVLDLRGWRATEKTPERIQITDGSAIVSLQSVPRNIETSMVATVFAPAMKSQGIAATFSPPRDGRVGFTIKVEGQTAFGWARVFHCPKASEAMLAFAETDAAAQTLWTRIGNARCRNEGEAAQAWPDATKPDAPSAK
jgi:hypothetical protein